MTRPAPRGAALVAALVAALGGCRAGLYPSPRVYGDGGDGGEAGDGDTGDEAGDDVGAWDVAPDLGAPACDLAPVIPGDAVARCSDPTHCDPDLICDTSTITCGAVCETDAECGEALGAIFGACVADRAECRYVSGFTQQYVCVLDCETDADCPGGATCAGVDHSTFGRYCRGD